MRFRLWSVVSGGQHDGPSCGRLGWPIGQAAPCALASDRQGDHLPHEHRIGLSLGPETTIVGNARVARARAQVTG